MQLEEDVAFITTESSVSVLCLPLVLPTTKHWVGTPVSNWSILNIWAGIPEGAGSTSSNGRLASRSADTSSMCGKLFDVLKL